MFGAVSLHAINDARGAVGFDEVTAVGSTNDKEKDVVVFRSTSQSETFRFTGASNTSQMQATGRDVSAEGFDRVFAFGSGNSDTAQFTELGGNDLEVLYVRSHKTQLVGADAEVIARAFD